MNAIATLLESAADRIEAEDDEPIRLDSPDGVLAAVQLADDGYLNEEETAQLMAALAKYPPIHVGYINRTLENVRFIGTSIVEADDPTFKVYTPEEWMGSSDAESLIEDIAAKLEERIDSDFQESPGKLYHATDSSNVESIMDEGLEAQSRTRGLTNRSVGAAIFTADSRDSISDAYGDTVLEIDLAAMKRDGLKYVATQEPSALEAEAAGALASALDLDSYDHPTEHDGADDPSTIILYVAVVPPKYIRVVP